MNEVKRLKDHIEQFENHNPGEKARVCGDDGKIYYDENFAVLLSDKIAKKQMQLESERALRIEAEKKLHELQDAIALRTQRQVSMGNNSNDYQIKYSLIFPKQGLMDEILISNIEESRKRGEAK